MRNFYTYKFERFTPEEKDQIISQKKKVIDWDDMYKIILILILFVYFNALTKEAYNFIQTGFKLLILIIILQTFFKDSIVFDKFKKIILLIINLGSNFTKRILD